jgi:23S rRNA pseudouridine2605 synthase
MANFKKSGGGNSRKGGRSGGSKSGERKFPANKPYTSHEERNADQREGKSSYGDRKPFEKRGGGDDDRKYGDKKPFGGRKDERDSGDKKPYERKKFGEGGGKYGDKKPFGDKRKKFGDEERGEKRSYGDDRGEKKSRGSYGDREKKPYARKEYGDREKKSYAKKYGEERGEKRSYVRKDEGDGEKKPYAKKYGEERGEKRPYIRKSSGDGEKRPFEKKYGGERGEKKSFGRKSYGDGEKKPYEKKFGDKERAGRKPYVRKEQGDDEKSSFEKRYTGEEGERNENYGKPYKKRSYEKKDYGDKKFGDKKPRKRTSPTPPKNDDGLIRLNKYIANAGICSRREADDLIKAGAITVNGKVVTEMGHKISPEDEVNYGGGIIKKEKKVYVLLNKPKDYITTVEDTHARKTVMDLIKGAGRERLYPVGRLDRNTTGILLLTNDGDMTKKLTHPSHEVKKIYQVSLDQNLRGEDFRKIAEGIELEDGLVKVDEISFVGDGKDRKEVGIELHSGRNRVVRRIFEHLGYEVVKLDRVFFAGLTKKDLPRGKWRFLSEKEIGYLKMA